MTAHSSEEADPPAWAESFLRTLLEPRDRDTVTGDLLEEYREVVLPQRGALRAKLWYVRQVASFVTAFGFVHWIGRLREDAMFERFARSSSLWLAAGSLALMTLLGALVRSSFGPPATLRVLVVIAVILGASAVASVRSRADIRLLGRIALVCGLLVAAVLLTRLLFDVFDPVDPVERFLAQARDDYSEFNYPRRWVPAGAVIAILMGAGLLAASRTGRVGMGTLAAIAAAATGSLAYVILVALGSTLSLGPRVPLGSEPRDFQFVGNVPMMLVPVLVMFSTVLGSVGALFGRAISSGGRSEDRRFRSRSPHSVNG